MNTLKTVTVPAGLWADIVDFIEQRSDVRDGSDGQQLPNDAMVLTLEIDRAGLTRGSN